MTEINYDLLSRLAVRPHPLLNASVCDCHHWCGEVNQEARVSHHLLDLVGIPHGKGYAQNLDARTFQAIRSLQEQDERLARIAGWHRRNVADGGLFVNECGECGLSWPCDTYRIASGTYSEDAP